MATIKVTQKRSSIGCTLTQKATLRGMGLTRTQMTVVIEDTPAMRGMIKNVIHLLEVELSSAS